MPGVAYPGVRDNRSTINTKTGYDDDDDDSYFIEFTHQTCMKKVHDNVHKQYSDKTMLTIKTKLLKIEQAPVNKGTFIGTGGTLG